MNNIPYESSTENSSTVEKNKKFKLRFLTAPLYRDVVFWLFFLCSIMTKSFYFQFTTQLSKRPFKAPVNIYMLLSTFGILLMISALVAVIFNKRRKLALFILDILLTFILLADTLYFRYFYNTITMALLYQVGVVGAVGGSVQSLFKIKDLVFIIDFPFLIAALVMLRKKAPFKLGILKRLAVAAVLLVLGLVSFKLAYHKTDTTTFPYDNNYVTSKLGAFYFHYYDTKRFIHENILEDKVLTSEEKKEIDDFYKNKIIEGDKLRGIAKGKNLLIVQVEAFQQFVVNKSINGKEITPNFNRLIKENTYFNNFYFQVGAGNTSDAEFLTNTSLYPAREGAVYFRYSSNTYHTLPKLLKAQGYSTSVFHAFNPSFWNRLAMYKSIGFDKFMSTNDYQKDEVVGWSVSDKSFFRQSLDTLDTGKPFYGFFITLSSHHPYDAGYPTDLDIGEYKGKLFGNYLKAANYADSAIGYLVDELKRRGLYDNTILMVYGDHAGVFKTEANDLAKFLGEEYSDLGWAKLQKVPALIHFPGNPNEGRVVETTCGDIDILPTVANLLGIDAPYAIGKDIFNTQKGYAVIRNGSVATDKYYYLNSAKQAYDNKTGIPLNKDEYVKEVEMLKKQLRVSDIILKKNAFKNGGYTR